MDKFKQFLIEDANELPTTEVEESGVLFKTGNKVTIPFIHNTEKSPYMGSRFQQDIEPSGRYILFDVNTDADQPKNWLKGKITLNNPLVIPLNTDPNGPIYDKNSWKMLLRKKYHKSGRSLSAAIREDGYDSIVTVDLKHKVTSEIVKL